MGVFVSTGVCSASPPCPPSMQAALDILVVSTLKVGGSACGTPTAASNGHMQARIATARGRPYRTNRLG